MCAAKRQTPPPDPATVPKAVVGRLSLYLRELQHLARTGNQTTSSHQLGQLLGFTDAQVRKDLAYFGHFGHPGIGYRCDELQTAIRRILGTDQTWNVALIGVGNLGRALLGYRGFARQGFDFKAAFDVDGPSIGKIVEGVLIHHMADLPSVVASEGIQIAMIAVPAVAAQTVAEQVVAAGVAGVVNFAPVTLSLPENISSVGVDLAIELEQISFSVANRPESR